MKATSPMILSHARKGRSRTVKFTFFMKINYDKEADALYIELSKGKFAKNKKIDDFTIIDLDKDSKLLGIELLKVSKRMPAESLSKVHVKNIMVV